MIIRQYSDFRILSTVAAEVTTQGLHIFPGKVRPNRWTVTPRGHLMYDGKPVADVRYKEAKNQIEFMLAVLNTAEEKR